jgi:hypothetical protein
LKCPFREDEFGCKDPSLTDCLKCNNLKWFIIKKLSEEEEKEDTTLE